MIISAKPNLDMGLVFNHQVKHLPSQWKDAYFTKDGRTALIGSLETIGIKPGSTILVPAYICNSVPNTLIDNGYKVIFVDISDELSVSINSIEEIIKDRKIDAILMVNYFGFMISRDSEIARGLKQLGIPLILDSCHSSFLDHGENLDKCIFDAVIFSLRKSIRTRDGGAFIVSKTKGHEINQTKNSYVKDLLFVITLKIESLVLKVGFPNIYGDSIQKLKNIFLRFRKKQIKHSGFKLKVKSQISHLTLKQISNQEMINAMIEKRRLHASIIFDHLRKISFPMIFNEIHQEDIPQIFPIIDERGGLEKYLRRNKIGAYKWPGKELPFQVSEFPEDYPNTIRMNESIVCLPTHQSMDKKQLNFLLTLIDHWNTQV